MHLAYKHTCARASFLEPEIWIFLCFPRLCVVLSLVFSLLLGDPICSTSSPGGDLVDGLPPVANTKAGVIGWGVDPDTYLGKKVRMVVFTGENTGAEDKGSEPIHTMDGLRQSSQDLAITIWM